MQLFDSRIHRIKMCAFQHNRPSKQAPAILTQQWYNLAVTDLGLMLMGRTKLAILVVTGSERILRQHKHGCKYKVIRRSIILRMIQKQQRDCLKCC